MHKKIDKGFYRSVAALAVPLALQNLINVGVQSADVIMLGRVDEVVLAASSLAGQVQFVLTLLFFGLSSGATVLAAQYRGKGDMRSIEKVMAITLRLSVALALVFFIVTMAAPGAIMRIFTSEQVLIDEGVKYLRIVAFCYLFMSFTNTYLTVLRSVEKVVISTVVYSISLVVNVALNAILIFGLLGVPAMGIEGAALATTLARALELVIVIVYAVRCKAPRLRWKDYITVNITLLRDYFKYSLPTILNELLWALAMSVYAIIVGHLGTTEAMTAAATAAYSVTSVVRQLAMVVCFGIASATAIIIGKTIGSGRKDLARVYARRLIRLSTLSGVFGALLIFAIRPLVPMAMNLSPLAREYLNFLLLVMCPYVIAGSINANMVIGILRGGGDTRFGLFMDVSCMWMVSILFGSTAAFLLGAPVQVVFLILFSDEFIKLPFALARYRSQRWLRDITRPAVE